MPFWFSGTAKKDGKSKTKSRGTAKPYDVRKWQAVIKDNKGIAAVAENLQPLGDKWVDEFARNYLTLDDKKQTWRLVQKVIDDARQEAKGSRG